MATLGSYSHWETKEIDIVCVELEVCVAWGVCCSHLHGPFNFLCACVAHNWLVQLAEGRSSREDRSGPRHFVERKMARLYRFESGLNRNSNLARCSFACRIQFYLGRTWLGRNGEASKLFMSALFWSVFTQFYRANASDSECQNASEDSEQEK